MKIEIQPEQLEKLFESGLIHPSDITCLDSETKSTLKMLCLQMCQPKNCKKCDVQDQCAKHQTFIAVETFKKNRQCSGCH